MDLTKLAGIFLPAFTMLALTGLSLTNSFGDEKASLSMFVLGLVIFFPIVFLFQGIVTAIHRYPIWQPLSMSVVAYGVLMFTIVKTNSYTYLIYYLIAFFVGYVITRLVTMRKGK